MPHIDLLIANTGHHLDAMRPVARELIARGFTCRLVSLCELRGLRSPLDDTEGAGLPVHRLVPRSFRSSPSQPGGSRVPSRRLRNLPRALFWHLYLNRRVRGWLGSKPDLVVVPNDAAFPYDRICDQLRRHKIRLVLLQEGIRFAETVFQDSEITEQGLSGADAIACWGETSARFFRARGAPPRSIHLTGNPRFDRLEATDWGSEAGDLTKALPPGGPTVAILTNPIEVWGFCSQSGKMALLESFLDGLDRLFETDGLRVVFKIHRQESLRDYQALIERHRHRERLAVLTDAPLYPLLELSDAAIVLASTVGLEALLLGTPLGVLEIPGHGFIHDFVSSGAARGVGWNASIADQTAALLDDDPRHNTALDVYLEQTLSARGNATGAVADLVADLVVPRPPAE